ncbi:hypothetical protein CFAM422_003122 [Trichoderma lentiforme]|uniref:Uncharacterized protein n=1 Tax=Trichoderma lentiforme TaxID=1567552 RepID=A0A9P4XKK2_9HYPO|nr:hypothetical protein CFAM422_003122 [Trichoderma lentiforme]
MANGNANWPFSVAGPARALDSIQIQPEAPKPIYLEVPDRRFIHSAVSLHFTGPGITNED